MPYAEVDPDFHLCPLPRYTSKETGNPHMATQRKYLHKEASQHITSHYYSIYTHPPGFYDEIKKIPQQYLQ